MKENDWPLVRYFLFKNPFYGLSVKGVLWWVTLGTWFPRLSICIAAVKLLQHLHLFKILRLNQCCSMLRGILYLKTLLNYSLSWHITEIYPNLKHYRSIVSHSIKSQQSPQALKTTAGVLISPSRWNFPAIGGRPRNEFFEKVSECRKESFSTLLNPSHWKTL